MMILGFLLLFLPFADGESTSLPAPSSILPPPHFLDDNLSESIHHGILKSDPVDHHGYPLAVGDLFDEKRPPSSFINPEITSDETKHRAVPSPPLNTLAFTQSNYEISVQWNIPSSDGGSPITGYKIEWSTDGGTNWSLLIDNFVPLPGAQNRLYYQIYSSRFTSERIFHFRVLATNSDGDSEPSAVVSTSATSPIGSKGIPTNAIATQSSSDAITISWAAPTDLSAGFSVTRYEIFRSDDNGDFFTLHATLPSNQLNYTDNSLTLNTRYGYLVRANVSGGFGLTLFPDINFVTLLDLGPPTAPTSLGATASGQTVIDLSWVAPSDHNGFAITGIQIEVSTDGGTSFSDLVPTTGSLIRSYSHTGLLPSTTRHYRVRAINAGGTSPPSNIATATTDPPTAPSAPIRRGALASGRTSIALTWFTPLDDGYSPITGYRIEVSPNGTGNWADLVSNTGNTQTSYSHTGLSPETKRYYRLYAINAVGESLPSSVFSGTTNPITQPFPPPQVTASASETSVTITWQAPDDGGSPITGYGIISKTQGVTGWKEVAADLAPTSRSFTHTNLLIDSTYVYIISATNNLGTGTVTTSDPVRVTGTKVAPSAPQSLTAAPGGSRIINLRWAAPQSYGGAIITGYKIEVSTDGGSRFTDLEPNLNSISYQHTGLPRESTRHYRVSAINSAGTGPVSNVVRGMTGTPTAVTAPSAPTSLTAAPSGQTAITLSWMAPSNTGGVPITGYQIQWSTDGNNPWTDVSPDHTGTTTTYSHTGLSAGTTRHYRLYAVNSAGRTSQASETASATTANNNDSGDSGDDSDSGGGSGGDSGSVSLPALTFASAAVSVNEAVGTHPISLTLSSSSNTPVTLDFTVSGTAIQGDDYTIQTPITIPANTTSVEIPVVILDDAVQENSETVIVTLTSGTGYELGGVSVFTLTITDNDGTALSFTETLSDQVYFVDSPVEKTLPAAQQGTPPYRYTLTPALPMGLRFDASTRTLSGTPTEEVAPKSFTYTVSDADGTTAMQTFTIEVTPLIASLAFAEMLGDQRYPIEIPINLILPVATGGLAPYTYSLTPAELPTGLTFDADTRTLSGTPTAAATSKTYTYTAEDLLGGSRKQDFNLEVYQLSFTETIADQSYARGQPITALVLPEAIGGISTITYTLTVLSLPLGLEYDAMTRTLRGTPTEVTPPVELTYVATDANKASANLAFTIEVVSPVHTETASGLPTEFLVHANYPNPFYHSTNLVFDLPWPAQVQVEILDVMGRRVATPTEVHLSAGWNHELELSELRLPSGSYLYQIRATSLEDTSSSVFVGHFMRVQ